jgi:hypothetical protein
MVGEKIALKLIEAAKAALAGSPPAQRSPQQSDDGAPSANSSAVEEPSASTS